jgi:hypothetical protein
VLFGADRFEFLVFLGYDANFNGDEPISTYIIRSLPNLAKLSAGGG